MHKQDETEDDCQMGGAAPGWLCKSGHLCPDLDICGEVPTKSFIHVQGMVVQRIRTYQGQDIK